MAATMKALRKVRAARGLQMDTVAVPLIGPTDVLVRVKTASICGTDLHIYGWDRWSQGRIKPPVTLGRSEEHTSELQSRLHLVCRLLLEKKKNIYIRYNKKKDR